MNRLTISELTPKLARREVSACEVMQACLDQIQRIDGQLRAFLSYDAADALAQADAADRLLAGGVNHATHPLLGVPVADIFTISCNLAGLCGISIPCGFTHPPPRLPIGLQLLGKPLGEETILRIAHAYEQSTDWHKQKASLGR